MTPLVDRQTLGTLSVTGRELAREPTDLVNDIIQIIKMSDIKQWSYPNTLFKLRQGLTKISIGRTTKITNITIGGEVTLPLFLFLDFQGRTFYFTMDDIKRLARINPPSR